MVTSSSSSSSSSPFLFSCCNANQVDNLQQWLIKSRISQSQPPSESWGGHLHRESDQNSAVYVAPQEGLMNADRIDALPGQPDGVNFNQYAGYVTVDPKAGRALFYYFVESPQHSATKPLVLWLNGGPGCSSLGYGAMEELGPFRVNSDGKTLFHNEYAWNNAANVIFLESPAGVGFSYSNTSSDYDDNGDKRTAEDSYTFLINWLERFPQYKSRDFFITGESYAGHYVPQLAYTILSKNNNTNQTIINLKGIAIGNAWIDDATYSKGVDDFFQSHTLNPDNLGNIDPYNIYAPICMSSTTKSTSNGSVNAFDPCSDYYVKSYLNLPEVQKALHVKATSWRSCSSFGWKDSPATVLPTIKELIGSGISVWIYSGDIDGVVPVTSSRYAINTMEVPVETTWRAWYSNGEVGGYVVVYKGVLFMTIRGAGHEVPSYQPERSLTMFSSFIEGKLPPQS